MLVYGITVSVFYFETLNEFGRLILKNKVAKIDGNSYYL